jgi:APA family basic amino acid/polyamine antiporter
LFTETKGIVAVLIMVPFLFVGFDVVPQAAEEVNLPPRDIGKVIIFSVFLAVAWYIGIALSVSLALPAEAIDREMTEGQGLVTAQAMIEVFGGTWAGKLLVLAGLAGIVTSWNAFFIGGSRAIYAMAHTHMLPGFLGKMHSKYNTPYNAILLIGALSCIAPFFGRQTLVWLVDASGLGIVVAYGLVALSFLVLRRREPEMNRPFKVANGEPVAFGALILAIGLGVLYLPGISPAALVWPQEWIIVLIGVTLGIVFYYWARLTYGEQDAVHLINNELSSGHSDLPIE